MLLWTIALPAVSSAGEPRSRLDQGIDAIHQGSFGDALIALDAAVVELERSGNGGGSGLTDAYLYRGWALVGLAQEEKAKASFKEALRRDATLRLSADRFPARVIRVFEAARSGKTSSVMERPSDVPKKAGLGAGAIAAIAGGVALVGGGTAAVIAGSTGDAAASAPTSAQAPPPSANNRAPSVSIAVSPDVYAVGKVTNLSFRADGNDPDGDTLSFSWDFDDGTPAIAGEFQVHRYSAPGVYKATVTATDPKGGRATAVKEITVRSLSGTWRLAPHGTTITIAQEGDSFRGTAPGFAIEAGRIMEPYGLSARVEDRTGSGCYPAVNQWTGEIRKGLDEIELSGARLCDDVHDSNYVVLRR